MADIGINLNFRSNANEIRNDVGSLRDTMNSMGRVDSFTQPPKTPPLLTDQYGVPFANQFNNVNDSETLFNNFNDVLSKSIDKLKDFYKNLDTTSIGNAAENARKNEEFSYWYNNRRPDRISGTESNNQNRNENNGNSNSIAKGFSVDSLKQAMGYAFEYIQMNNTYRRDFASGNYLGATTNMIRNSGNFAGGIVSSIGQALAFIPGMQGIGLIAALGGQAIKGISGKIAGERDANFAEADAYEKTLSTVYGFNKKFRTGSTWEENAAEGIKTLNLATDYAKDTNLNTLDFLSYASGQAQYGMDKMQALEKTNQAARFAYSTGADINGIQHLIGLSSRYGDNSDVLHSLVQGRNASGMTKGQTDEFLQSMLSVMENGIAKGFVKSADEVADDLAALSILSNGSQLWTGQQGAQRLQSMNSGMQNATNLSTTEQILMFQAMRNVPVNLKDNGRSYALGGGSYIDTMAMMEKGITPLFLDNFKTQLNTAFGDDRESKVEAIRKGMQLSYNGALQVYDMFRNGKTSAEIARKIESSKGTDEDFFSDERQKSNALNTISSNVATMGQQKFWLEILELNKKGITAETLENRATAADMTTAEIIANPEPDVLNSMEGSLAMHSATEAVRRGEYKRAIDRYFELGYDPGGIMDYSSMRDNVLAEKLADPNYGNEAQDDYIKATIANKLGNNLNQDNLVAVLKKLSENTNVMNLYGTERFMGLIGNAVSDAITSALGTLNLVTNNSYGR